MPGAIDRKKFLQLLLLAPLSIAAKPLQFLGQPTVLQPFSNNNVQYYRIGENGYDELRQGFNKRFNKKPSIIALCYNTAGVSEAIRYAANNKLAIAVKSGGHCMEGFSGIEGGMVINMSAMNSIEWVNTDTVKLHSGCKLAQIYDNLLPKKKLIPGGSCAGVAIGGLSLGGGYGLMARKFGLTCDSLLSLTMVDGTGRTITASGNDELMWACRGGNNGNFGVVTEMVFKTYPAPTAMESYRFRAYKMDTMRAKNILKTWFDLTATLPNDCFSAYVLNGKTLYILLTNVGRQTEAVKNFVSRLSSVTDKTTHNRAQPLQQALKAYYGKTKPMYFKNASAGLYKNFAEIEMFIDQALAIVLSTPGMIYQVNTLGGKIQDPVAESASAFPHRACNYFSELQTYWEQPSQEKRLLDRFQQVQDVFLDNRITAQYRNYPDINFKNWSTAYYGNHYNRLQQVKAKYDPNNLFRYEQSIRLA